MGWSYERRQLVLIVGDGMAPATDASLKRLVHVLRERQISISRDDVEWAFQSPATKDQVCRWVDEELQHTTLLTYEEEKL
jgi:hypothetical protein